MSASAVQNKILDIYQKNSAIDTEFATALTGAASSSGAVVTGSGTSFLTELRVNDYMGNITKGYRKIISITDADTLIVESAFDTALSGDTIKKTEVKKGFAKNENLSEAGKILRIVFVASSDVALEAARKLGVAISHSRILAVYGFIIAVGFYEPDDITADERKSGYDKLLRDVIDNNMTIGSLCIGITEMGRLMMIESPQDQGIYFGAMSLVCYKLETAGNR